MTIDHPLIPNTGDNGVKESIPIKIVEWENDKFLNIATNILVEEPLSIRIEGNPYSVIMRTPGEETFHAAGLCLAEGIVDDPADIDNIGLCDEGDTNVVTVTLAPERRKKIPEILARKNYLSQTSCGICGKELIKDLNQFIKPFIFREKIDLEKAMVCFDKFPQYQTMRTRTKSSHAAALFNHTYDLISISEDVGRHNALDKAIGKLFLENRLKDVFFLVLSSRISYELVQKAARAGIQFIISYSLPTYLSIEVASHLGMTLACSNKKSGLFIFCGKENIKR
ncbi:MAG: formate dehydrogenase accessory sulfurtransferase FdhD [Proteobacteria bacterium]|nr:formate dehydrogenase accessory sulfurtransferase FdhD [Pseudomonadota bacterium]